MSAPASAQAVADSAPAAVEHVHEGLHGMVALDHPVALVGLVVVSGVVLLVASWHRKRKEKKD